MRPIIWPFNAKNCLDKEFGPQSLGLFVHNWKVFMEIPHGGHFWEIPNAFCLDNIAIIYKQNSYRDLETKVSKVKGITFLFLIPMEWFLSKHLMLVLIVLLQINGYKACLEEERMGLLEFKWFVKSNNEDADGLLRSWVDDRESDCCGWERVKCNSITGRVNELSLGNIRQIEESSSLIRIYTRIWSLNTSLFRPFQELTSLDLSRNWFKGCLETEGMDSLFCNIPSNCAWFISFTAWQLLYM